MQRKIQKKTQNNYKRKTTKAVQSLKGIELLSLSVDGLRLLDFKEAIEFFAINN